MLSKLYNTTSSRSLKLSLQHNSPIFVQKFDASKSSNFVEISFDEKKLKLETGSLAKMADGSILGSIGGTSVLATVVCKPKSVFSGMLPLTVDYRHKMAAANRIPTNYFRRDLAPSESEILTSRLIDRMLRPLFPRGFAHDVQISCDALSLDMTSGHDPRVAAANAAAAALTISDVPWTYGPVALTRIIARRESSTLVVNPTRRDTLDASVDVLVGGAAGGRLIMLDGFANDAPDDLVAKCIQVGLDNTERIVERMLILKEKCGKTTREVLTTFFQPNPKLVADVTVLAQMQLKEVFQNASLDKLSRDKAIQSVREKVFETIRNSYNESETNSADFKPDQTGLDLAFSAVYSTLFRQYFFETGRRVDGRLGHQLRPITCQTDLFPSLHGSAMFQRGQTQVLSTLTLDSMEAALKNDTASVFLGGLKEKMFMLAYEFPQYANNELGFATNRPNRREIGHAALAEKSLRSTMPDEFPFATRLSCQVLESNGSSSMASVCAGSLALMDGGVPVKASCAGVAMGMLSEANENEPTKLKRYSFLTDITGLEDYAGDMDFKIAGTENGLTAFQLDVKTPAGLSIAMTREVLENGRAARLAILKTMSEQVGHKRRKTLKSNGPAVEELVVPMSKRLRMTRMGGYALRKLESDYGVQITQVDTQTFRIFAPNQDLLIEVKQSIDNLLEKAADQTKDLEFGAIYNCQVVEVLESGISVTLSAGAADPIFIPNSQLDLRPIRHPDALGLRVGSDVMVKYFGRDPVSGQIRLSRKLLLKTAIDQPAGFSNASSDDKSPSAKKAC